jgi:hypothetical protein
MEARQAEVTAAWDLAVALHGVASGEILGPVDTASTPSGAVLGDSALGEDFHLLRDCVEQLCEISGSSLPLASPPPGLSR